ncbi:TPA: hypothetical protein ACH3X1_013398 [Trebouxia sp. C0004]
MDDDEAAAAAAAPANAAEGNMAQAKAITRVIDDPSTAAAEKQQEISTILNVGPPTRCDLYFQAEYTPNPVTKTITYLHGEARHWWQQVGSKTLYAASTFEMFSQAFLAHFVKPSDSAKACAEILHLKQIDCNR